MKPEGGARPVLEGELIVITGPTASGKSACALELCERISGALVSCDSMQLYRGMDIGTAKPFARERAAVEHFMIDVLDPDERCSAAAYREMATPIIERLFSLGVQPVLCGGTGLYIDALTRPLGFSVEGDAAVRAELAAILDEKGGKQRLHDMLAAADPESARRLHENDTRRVIRALEVIRLTGYTLTEQARHDAERVGDFRARLFAPDWPRDALYRRIDRRVDEMIERGLVEEVRSLMDALPPGATAMQAIGYKEIVRALRGGCSLDDAISDIKRGTRNYAKRQLTWFRRDPRVRWIPAEGRAPGAIVDEITDCLRDPASK